MNILVLVSADAEWRVVKEELPGRTIVSTPLGETFQADLGCGPIRFFHGGWGKISAAATAQYAIHCWKPDLLVNLGTCGGFSGRIKRGTLLLVEKTIVYDIIEQMGDPDEAIASYTTTLDLSWLKEPYPHPVQRGLLVSADRDILPGDIPHLVEKYHAVAADWETGAIAWVANRNRVKCLILRGVTDLVSVKSGEAYGSLELFHHRSRQVMRALLVQLPDWIAHSGLSPLPNPLFHKVDCIRLYVSSLENGLDFYRRQLGHQLIWRDEHAAGLRMADTDAELVLQTEDEHQEVDLTVPSADEAAQRFRQAGGELLVEPFDIHIGRCAVVRDPWGNQLVLLDTTRGLLATDEDGNIIGNLK